MNSEIQKQLTLFSEWVRNQPQFPEIPEKLLHRFLHSCYYDLDNAKSALELFVSIRNETPELFTNRDPLSPSIQETMKIVKMAVYETTDKKHIWIWQVNDPGFDRFETLHDSRLFLLTADTWFLTDRLADDDIVIVDVKDFNYKFITKYNSILGKTISKYQGGAMPMRLKQIHVINTPLIVDKIYSLFKPLLKSDVKEKIHFHTPNSNTLFDYVHKDDLPKDLGGIRDSLDIYTKKMKEMMLTKRDVLARDDLWRKNTAKPEADNAKSFRNLGID
ncbi:alpha-tocopherol transfer protein isoform X2 [Bombyx mori]|uniref:CRAL-TRIO domain-containing protein n=1 Tax=Bombyx mori TaxID=7091 RepID=A0A8R2DN02_BOMMO|nr:alpha-tocopherol transfer protein [Bombyx mori]XP_004929637.1 alpha-tocopherol transfer protein [Bombyx mori]XP_012548860.1 alpha-tocopherol transfer protein [Bombyx mori]XP_021205936.1 alpha-tocopherol transfer protein [Bombyx mori]XP_021205938.1 alpha-tocopherol transfer protein [Bombyx mori]XP_021205939.1 alpha-tocopherol transfer protein [Bombyx mori]